MKLGPSVENQISRDGVLISYHCYTGHFACHHYYRPHFDVDFDKCLHTRSHCIILVKVIAT